MVRQVECTVIPTYYVKLELFALPAGKYPLPSPSKLLSQEITLFFDETNAKRCYKICEQALKEGQDE